MKAKQQINWIFYIILSLSLATCKGGCDKKCKDNTATGTIYVQCTLLSGTLGCGNPPSTMLDSYNLNQDNAFSKSRSANSKWYIKFTITGICDDEKSFRIVKEGPSEAKPILISGKLYFKMLDIPINRDLTISSEVKSPCFAGLEGCCPTGSTDNNTRLDYISAELFEQAIDEEKLDASFFESFRNCGCSL